MRMKTIMILTMFSGLGLLLPACGAAAPEATPSPVPERGGELLYVLSNSSPHVSVIDTASNEIVETTDILDFTAWAWNDDNNYFDGENLWLGLRDPETNEAEVMALNLDTLQVTRRIAIGTDELTLYIGKPTSDGILHIGKMGSGQVVAIDTKDFEVLDTWDVPVNGDVVCDADTTVGDDGVERFYYPTRKGDTLVSIDPHTGETLKEVNAPEGSNPLMLTTAPDGGVWVQEVASNTNAVFDPVTLELITRFPTGKAPIVASFDKEGRFGYIGHNDDTVVSVVDVETLKEVERVEVGANPQKLAIQPQGEYLYAILTKEASVAVVDTSSWEVTERIPIGTDPSGIFLRDRAEQ